jgi:GR25 family glycosyltransferase involved in LPS biosynthesis
MNFIRIEIMIFGRYINLDKSVERRQIIESQIVNLNLQHLIKRFSAIESRESNSKIPNTVLGCLLSHLNIIRNAPNLNHLLILEDDVVLSSRLSDSLEKINHYLDRTDVDVLFLGQTLLFNDSSRHRYLIGLMNKKKYDDHSFEFLNGEKLYRYGTFAYIINRKSLNKVRSLLLNIENSENISPIDDILGALIRSKKLTCRIAFPYLIGLNSDFPTTLSDRKNAQIHNSHCKLVNMYFQDFVMPDNISSWRIVLEDKPDPLALIVAEEMYRQLIIS